MVHIAVEADLPGRLHLVHQIPVQFYASGGGSAGSEICGRFAGDIGGKGYDIAIFAGAVTTAVAFHAHFIFGFCQKFGEGCIGSGRGNGLPIAGGNRMTQN